MKTKLSRGAKWTIALVGLCILCFIVVPLIVSPTTADPHAGHDHAEGDTHTQQAGHDHADAAHNKAAKDSYEVRQLENGSYNLYYDDGNGPVLDHGQDGQPQQMVVSGADRVRYLFFYTLTYELGGGRLDDVLADAYYRRCRHQR